MNWLDALNRRFGRLLVGYWITIVLFLVISMTAVYLVNVLVFGPMIGDMPYSASSTQILAAMMPWNLGFTLFCVVAAALLIRFNLIEPLLKRRRQLEADLASAPPREQIHALAEQRAKLTEQLDTVLDDNIALRDEMQVQQVDTRVQEQRLNAVISSTQEPLMLLGAKGDLLYLSQSMLSLLNVRQQDAHSIALGQLLRLFNGDKDNPREYPLDQLIDTALSQASAIPKLQQVVLLDQSGREHRAMLSTQAILDAGGALQGLMLRAQPTDSPTIAATYAQVRHEAGRADLEQRLEELMVTAQRKDAEHTLVLVSLDCALDIYHQHGMAAVDEWSWLIKQMLREEFGAALELFSFNGFFVALVLPFKAPEECQDACERLRNAVELRDFQWRKQAYRGSVSMVLSPLDSHVQSVAALLEDTDKTLRQAHVMGGNRVLVNATDEVNVQARAIDEQLTKWLKVLDRDTRLHLQSLALCAAPDSELPAQILTQVKVEMEDGFWADPAAFLASAARVNLLQDIDRWLLRETLEAYKRHQEVALTHGSIIVPLHMQSVMADGFLSDVQDMLIDSGIDAQRLCLGLTEQDSLNHPSQTRRFTQACREMGMTFALLGCRVSSMQTVVVELEPAVIGLHPALSALDNQEGVAEAALRYVVSCAHARGMRVAVTEALDESRQAGLRALGVDYVGELGGGLGPLY